MAWQLGILKNCFSFFLQNITGALFRLIRPFSNIKKSNLQQTNEANYRSNICCPDLNSQPLKHLNPNLTNRTGLLPFCTSIWMGHTTQFFVSATLNGIGLNAIWWYWPLCILIRIQHKAKSKVQNNSQHSYRPNQAPAELGDYQT